MQNRREKYINWAIFMLISIIWGSSFILIKEGMKALKATDVAAIRMLSAGLILSPIAFRQVRKIPRGSMPYILVSGWLGSFIPAILFCLAEEKIDSSLASFLNALTPIFTIIVGAMFFGNRIPKRQAAAVSIAFAGMLLLFLASGTIDTKYMAYSSLVLLATLSYGININLVARHLKIIGSLNITAIACASLVIPSLVVLIFSGFFSYSFSGISFWRATAASTLLGVLGTSLATVLFYVLLKRAGAVFSSMVTYGIPFVALFWGVLAGETITVLQVAGLAVILFGVYMSNK